MRKVVVPKVKRNPPKTNFYAQGMKILSEAIDLGRTREEIEQDEQITETSNESKTDKGTNETRKTN